MGKVAQIKRAFSKLSHDEKLKLHRGGYAGYGYRNKGFSYCTSYRSLVAKLATNYYNEHLASEHRAAQAEKHVVERAYLNKEPWAIKIIDNTRG